MATKKEDEAAAKAIADAEAEAAAKAIADAEAEAAAKAIADAEAEAAAKFVKVRPTRGYMFEPFQKVSIQEGVETPVEKSSWVDSQVEAGLLTIC